jgi:hypothetical protein
MSASILLGSFSRHHSRTDHPGWFLLRHIGREVLVGFSWLRSCIFAGCPRNIPLRRYAGHEHYCNNDEVGQAASPNGGSNAGRSGSLFSVRQGGC